MNKPKGGRGQTAPYQTTHIRIPVPLKLKIRKVIDAYHEFVFNGNSSESPNYPGQPNLVSMMTVEEAKEAAREILRSELSPRESLSKLLTALYEGRIDPKELG